MYCARTDTQVAILHFHLRLAKVGSVVNTTIHQYSVQDHTQVTYLRIMTHTMTHIIMFDHLWASLLEFKSYLEYEECLQTSLLIQSSARDDRCRKIFS